MTELKKLLGFMSSWDRQATLDKYEAMFDAAGDPEAVMDELGSPTKVAVALAKDYVSSRPPGEAVDRDEPEIEIVSLEQLLAEEDAGVSLEIAPPPEEEAPAPEAPEPPPVPVIERLLAETAREDPQAEASAPEGKGGAIFAIYCVLAVVIGLPVAVALLCAGLAICAAGVAAIVGVFSVVPGALPEFPLINNKLLVLGAGLLAGGAGLLLAWFGLWLGLTLCRLWIWKLILPLGRRIRNGKGAQEA